MIIRRNKRDILLIEMREKVKGEGKMIVKWKREKE